MKQSRVYIYGKNSKWKVYLTVFKKFLLFIEWSLCIQTNKDKRKENEGRKYDGKWGNEIKKKNEEKAFFFF